MPIGGNGQMMYLPETNNGPSGPWTMYETKIVIALCIVFFVVSLISIITEWQFAKKKLSLKRYLSEVIQCGFGTKATPYEVSMFTCFILLLFYIVFIPSVIGFSVYGLMNIM